MMMMMMIRFKFMVEFFFIEKEKNVSLYCLWMNIIRCPNNFVFVSARNQRKNDVFGISFSNEKMLHYLHKTITTTTTTINVDAWLLYFIIWFLFLLLLLLLSSLSFSIPRKSDFYHFVFYLFSKFDANMNSSEIDLFCSCFFPISIYKNFASCIVKLMLLMMMYNDDGWKLSIESNKMNLYWILMYP